jgi:hypothetical protein
MYRETERDAIISREGEEMMKAKLLVLCLLAAIPLAAASISGVGVNPCLVVKGQECTIEWARSGAMAAQVNITLWLAGAKQAEILNVPNPEGNNEKTWMVPAGLPAGKYVFRVATTDGQFKAESEYAIDQKRLVMSKGPAGTLVTGAMVSISWLGFGLGISPPCYVDLYQNGTLVKRLEQNEMNRSFGCGTGTFWKVGYWLDPMTGDWEAEPRFPVGGGYKIRISDGTGTYVDESETFTIAAGVDPGMFIKRFRRLTRIPVGPVPGCPMCGEVQLEELWRIFESSPEVQEIQLWQGGRMLAKLAERGIAARRLAGRRVEFGGSFALLRQGGAGFELRLLGARGKLLGTQAVVLNFKAR